MSNPRDTGRYDAFTDSYVDQQVRIDFAWGNVPMQPNDDRGMDELDPALDSHIIATSGYEGFPAFLQGAPYDDTIENVTIPNLVGLTATAAIAALDSAGISYTIATTSSGANSGNNNTIKQQTPTAGTVFNATDVPSVAITKYVSGNPILAAKYDSMAGMMNGGYSYSLILPGQTVKPAVGDKITITGTNFGAGALSWNITWRVGEVMNDNAYTTGSTKVMMTYVDSMAMPEPLGPWTTTPGLWVLVPHVTPSSVTFVTNMGPGPSVEVSNVANPNNSSQRDGALQLDIPVSSTAGTEIMYGTDLPTSNGWAGKQVTFSNIVKTFGMGDVSVLNGVKTIASSSIVSTMNGNAIRLVFTDMTSIGDNMGADRITGTMTLNWV